MKISYIIGSLSSSSSSSSSASMFLLSRFPISSQSSTVFYFQLLSLSRVFSVAIPFHAHKHSNVSFGDGTHSFIYLCRRSVFFLQHIYSFRCRIDFHNQSVITIVNLNVDASFWPFSGLFMRFSLFCMECAPYFFFFRSLQPNLFNIRD